MISLHKTIHKTVNKLFILRKVIEKRVKYQITASVKCILVIYISYYKFV